MAERLIQDTRGVLVDAIERHGLRGWVVIPIPSNAAQLALVGKDAEDIWLVTIQRAKFSVHS